MHIDKYPYGMERQVIGGKSVKLNKSQQEVQKKGWDLVDRMIFATSDKEMEVYIPEIVQLIREVKEKHPNDICDKTIIWNLRNMILHQDTPPYGRALGYLSEGVNINRIIELSESEE